MSPPLTHHCRHSYRASPSTHQIHPVPHALCRRHQVSAGARRSRAHTHTHSTHARTRQFTLFFSSSAIFFKRHLAGRHARACLHYSPRWSFTQLSDLCLISVWSRFCFFSKIARRVNPQCTTPTRHTTSRSTAEGRGHAASEQSTAASNAHQQRKSTALSWHHVGSGGHLQHQRAGALVPHPELAQGQPHQRPHLGSAAGRQASSAGKMVFVDASCL
jgi:hypothetical protein